MVLLHHMSEQFCTKGVTGMIAARKGDSAVIKNLVAARSGYCKAALD
jgi:hypothetical protein